MKIHTWMKLLLSVLVGNVVYFLITNRLPTGLTHETFRFDAGLLVDMAICAIVYLLIQKVS
jgi:hypothetical protein